MISPLASIAPGAKIGKNVTIQPFAYIEDNVEGTTASLCLMPAY